MDNAANNPNDPEIKATSPAPAPKHRLDYFVWFTSIATAVVAASLSLYQAHISSDTEKRSLRAYLIIDDKGNKSFKRGELARWDIAIYNFGKTPSSETTSVVKLFLGGDALSKAHTFLRDPTSNPDTRTMMIVPPSGTDSPIYSSILSETPMTDDITALAHANNGVIVLAGRAWYRDVFSDLHHTDFCRMTLAGGAVAYCPTDNELD
ncbi:hypothetical protein HAP47_0021750 [Bradyrhizobium sp. 41S5]|uniref:hypothetical protein n=1 Tax=Bradyrhizobium sp. 41S5 TaxID=1404443 RepID=UPI00156BB529|nr:hypothetical protein [Bradyrhizobium sp. 41S5]UFX41924.1 hypothetical protein HAP47_0021750 [Bradyrhizobium sp. 41S5]